MPFDKVGMQKAHENLCLQDRHYDAVMDVLEYVLDVTVNGRRMVLEEMKVGVLTQAEALRADVLGRPSSPQLSPPPPPLTTTHIGKGELQWFTPGYLPISYLRLNDAEKLGNESKSRESNATESGMAEETVVGTPSDVIGEDYFSLKPMEGKRQRQLWQKMKYSKDRCVQS